MTKINWKNLLSNQCPKCGAVLDDETKAGDTEPMIRCALFGHGGTFDCSFIIKKTRFETLKKDIGTVQAHRELEHDNFEALQNLGHEEDEGEESEYGFGGLGLMV